MDTFGGGMDSILLELEAAIKNSYMSEFEDFVKNEEADVRENPLPSKILDCNNEEIMIKALSEMDSDFEVENMLKIEEQAYLNIFQDKEKVFSNLYYLSSKRISCLVKALQRLIKERNFDEELRGRIEVNKKELIGTLQDKIRCLNDKVHLLQEELECERVELEDRKDMYSKLSNKYEDLVYELEMFKGNNEKLLKKLEIESLFKFEQDLQNSLKVVAKIKNEKILEYAADLKSLKQSQEDAKKCIICHENQVCILLKPCNHANVCESCSYKLTNCPIDRAVIISQEKIYL